MVRLNFNWCPFDLWVHGLNSLYHDKEFSFSCEEVVVFRLNERLAPVAVCNSLILIAYVLLLKEVSGKSICKSIVIVHE